LALGYYALLWLRGPTGDFLDLAQYLPDMMLPAELQGQPHSMPAARVMADQPIRQGTIPAPNSTSDATDSAEVQASFTTTEEPTPGKSNVVGDRYGSETHAEQPVEEPAALDIQAAAPLAGDATSAGAQRPAKAPSFTADELADALQAARDAQPSLMAGNLEDGREIQRAKGAAYSALADLAQKATLVDVSTATESLAAALQAAEELYRLTLSDPHTRREVAVITPKWIASPHRKHGGVFFAASLSNPQQAGDTIECQAALESGQSLTLLVPPGLADRLDDSLRLVGVIGWIVDEPAAQLSGYAGDAKQAVWVGKLIPVE
jgi:hypothetical protein